MRNGQFTLKRIRVKAGPYSYFAYRVHGWLRGRRIRKQYQSEAEAVGAKARFEIEAANLDQVRPVNTALSVDQVRAAESAFHRLGDRPLSFAVDWFLANYRPPVVSQPLAQAIAAFRADRAPRVSFYVARDYKRELGTLESALPGREVHSITTEELQTYMEARRLGPKAWNNVRGLLHAFFEWTRLKPRQWCGDNPARPLATHRISRGIPCVLSAQQAADLMTYVEGYPTGTRQAGRPGYLVPYFALCLFAGIRPAVPHGETCRLGRLPAPELAKSIDMANGVIRIPPAISKTRDLRQVTIQPNLRLWLERYPLSEFPIVVPAMQAKVMEVRKRFGLTDDVLRHTFCSMHAARFKSLGGTALEAGNSESIIKRHYLNMVTAAEADSFWAILPKSGANR